jgi:hypothetical protein
MMVQLVVQFAENARLEGEIRKNLASDNAWRVGVRKLTPTYGPGHDMRLLEHYEPQEHTVLEMRWLTELAPASSPACRLG